MKPIVRWVYSPTKHLIRGQVALSFRLRSRYGANRAGRVDGRARGGPGQGKKRSLGGQKAGVQNLFGGMLSGKTNITMENHHF